MVPAILAKCGDLPDSQEAEGHARNREPTTDRADVGTQQFACWLNDKELLRPWHTIFFKRRSTTDQTFRRTQ